MKNTKILINKIRRGLRQLWAQDIWHLQPTAPVSWRYFLLNQSPQIQLHRRLWWHSRYKLPGIFWLPLELVRWIYWQLWAGPRIVSEATAKYGPRVEVRFGISLAQQKSLLSYWSISWCINPYVGYDWQLYQPGVDGLSIIYGSETQAFHALRNRKAGATKADYRLLGDKIAIAELLSKQGIPMVETTHVSSGEWQDIETALMRHRKLFCKLRSGNQGESAFAVWRNANGLRGLSHDGTELLDENAIRNAWQILVAKGEVLIQPLLENHPDLAQVLASSEAVVLRVVTRIKPDGIFTWWAELQVPGRVSPAWRRGFWRFTVSVRQGTISAQDPQSQLIQSWQDEYDNVWQEIQSISSIPYLFDIFGYSQVAHAMLPKVWAIAWDWVITPDGPVLLEGNSGWGLDQAQQQGVDLVAVV